MLVRYDIHAIVRAFPFTRCVNVKYLSDVKNPVQVEPLCNASTLLSRILLIVIDQVDNDTSINLAFCPSHMK